MTRKKQAAQWALIIVLGGVLVGAGFWLGWTSGTNHPKSVVVSGIANMGTPSSTLADFSTFWQAWQEINDNYLRNPSTTPQQKVYGAISGLVDSLGDPYTQFFTPADSKQFQENIAGNFGGVGAELGANKDGHIVIIAPLKGTPAENAGLKAEDEIVAVNGSSTAGMGVDQAVSIIRGPIGTNVTLSIFRDGWTKPQDFKLIRAKIVVPSVDFTMKNDVALIGLHEFTQDADQDFYQALVKAVNNNAKGVVLDLRDDPGGYLEVAVDLAGYFLKPGTLIVKEVGRTVPDETFKSSGDGSLADLPVVILINGGSASAAEIMAGALHDNRNIKLIGEKSFGKGTVQELEDLADGSSIKMTIAHWVLPSGRILDHDGLQPDYEVKLTDDDIKNKKDPQLDKALQVLEQQIAN